MLDRGYADFREFFFLRSSLYRERDRDARDPSEVVVVASLHNGYILPSLAKKRGGQGNGLLSSPPNYYV